MEIRSIRPSELEAARRLLEENGWRERVADLEELRLLVSRSRRALAAGDRPRIAEGEGRQ